MDPVNPKALKGKFKNRADKDINNDGKVDGSDEYLHSRRKAVSKAIGKIKESVAIFESHFEVGQKVEYEAEDGGEYYGTIVKMDKPEVGAYYHVKLENGKVVKAKPDQLEAEDDDDDEDDEDDDKEDMNEDVRKMSHGRLKFHMNNKNVPHGSYSWDQMKAERDRRLKTGQGEAYKKAKMSMSEEAEELDEISKKTLGSYVNKASADRAQNAYKMGKEGGINFKGLKRSQGIKRAVNRLTKEEAELGEEKWLVTWKQKNTGNDGRDYMDSSQFHATEREARLHKGKLKYDPRVLRNSPTMKKIKEEAELDEAKTDVYHQHMLKALGKSRLPKNHSYTSAIANNGDFVVKDGGGRVIGRIAKGKHDLKEAELDGDMKAERDRRLKSGQGEAYKKAKMSMSEEVENLDEISRDTVRSYIRKASVNKMTGEKSNKDRTAGIETAGKKAYGIGGKAKVMAKEEALDEVLKVSDGMGAWIDDFKKSDAPQFKGKDDKERREMAVAAFLAAKRAGKE